MVVQSRVRLCPICAKPLHDLERVEAKHTPASVPEDAPRIYSVTRRYTIARCENGHMLRRANDGIFGMATEPTVWGHPTHWRHA